jgi:hypothetical protein
VCTSYFPPLSLGHEKTLRVKKETSLLCLSVQLVLAEKSSLWWWVVVMVVTLVFSLGFDQAEQLTKP